MKVRRFSEPIRAYKGRTLSSSQKGKLPATPQGPVIRATTWREEIQALTEYLEKEGGEELQLKVTEVEVKDQEIPAADGNVSEKLKAASDAWQELPTASKQAKSIVKYGVMCNANVTGRYQEKNNKSYTDNEQFGLEAIEKLFACGSAEPCSKEELKCISPLSVATAAGRKCRLCLDLSRCINLSCGGKKISIQAMRQFQDQVGRGCWAITYDLKSAFHHLRLHPSAKKFMGFSYRKKVKGRWSKKASFGRFKVTPFGWIRSPEKLQTITKSVCAKWSTRDAIKNVIHVDDGCAWADTEEQAQEASNVMVRDLDKYGLELSRDKSILTPTQDFEWVGYRWKLKEFNISVPEPKLGRVRAAVQSLLKKPGNTRTIAETASVVGKLISMTPALGASALFNCRELLSCIAVESTKKGWQGSWQLTDRAKEELQFWMDNLLRLGRAGQPIRRPASAATVHGKKLASDAGEFFSGFVMFTSKAGLTPERQFQYTFSEEEGGSSSTWREMRGINLGFRDAAPSLKGGRATVLTDSQPAERAFKYGSMLAELQTQARELWATAGQFSIELTVLWKRRSEKEGKMADSLTREWVRGRRMFRQEYKLSRKDFEQCQLAAGVQCEVDVFASDWSALLDKFFSKYYMPGCAGADCFTLQWGREPVWLHPAVEDLRAAVEKAEEQRALGLLLVPDLISELSVVELKRERDERVKLVQRRQMVFTSPRWRKNTMFSGLSSFEVSLYHFDFR